MEFLEKTGDPEKIKNLQKSGLFWASPFTMQLVCTLLKCVTWPAKAFPEFFLFLVLIFRVILSGWNPGIHPVKSGVAKGLLQGRPLQLPMGWEVGEELTKSWPTFEQLCVQNLAWAISYCFGPTKSAYKIRLARSWPRVGHGLPTFDTNVSVLKL